MFSFTSESQISYRFVQILHVLSFGFLLTCCSPPAEAMDVLKDETETGTVIANMLHVRAKPGEKYEVVSRLEFGDKITIKVERDDWLGVLAPVKTEAWVAANRINDGKVVKDNVPLYAGPGTIFSSYHTLNQGEKVTVLRTTNDGWAKIQPMDDFVVWVHRNYVRISSPATNESTNESSTEENNEIVFQAEEGRPWDEDKQNSVDEQDEYLIHAIMPKPVERDVVLIGEKEKIQKSGTIVSLDETNYPFRYALAKKVNSTYYPLAYLSPEYGELEKWTGKTVTLSGVQSWIRGWPRPMIQIQKIESIDSGNE